MWLAAGSPEAVEWSAKQGYTIMMDPHASHREIGRKRQLYEDTLVAAGHSMEGRQIPMARLLAVAPTRAEAEDVARRGASWIVAAYANPGRQAIVSPTVTEAGPPGHQVDPVQRYVDDVVIWGTPEEVTDQIAELREGISLDYLMCAPLSHSTFEMFTERVMPKLI
jgi:alkanesulfonate monooxygenase SsuD/methylene tetrahydromethanopterin reductase-like flavin-dependent oxidoreductase (luciferase family)